MDNCKLCAFVVYRIKVEFIYLFLRPICYLAQWSQYLNNEQTNKQTSWLKQGNEKKVVIKMSAHLRQGYF